MIRVLKALQAGNSEVSSLHWGKKGLFGGDLDGFIHIYETDNSKDGGLCHLGHLTSIKVHDFAVTSLCCINNLLISCSLDGKIFKYNIGTKVLEQIAENITDCFVMCAVESKNTVLFGTTKGILYIYSVSSKTVSEPIEIFKEAICSLSLHPLQNKVVILSSTEFVLFDLEANKIESRLKMTADNCTCAAVADNALSCVVSTTEGSARVVDMISMKEVGCVAIDQSELNRTAAIDYGKRFIMTSSDGKVCMFNLNQMIKEPGVKVGKKPLLAVAVQPTEMKIAVSGCENIITLLDFD